MLSKSVRHFATKLPKADVVPNAYDGPSYDTILKIRSDRLVPCIKSHFKKPLLIHQGHMQWLFDHTGKRYLDMFGGIVTVSVGHCHPRVNQALTKQMNTLWHTTNIYMHPKIHEYAEALTSTLPGDLKVVYFVNSGSEANDLASMMVRLHTGNQDLIVLKNSYHGGVSSTIAMTAQSTWKFPLPSYNIHCAKNPDVYRGPFGGSQCRDSPVQTERKCNCNSGDCHASEAYADDVKEILDYCLPKKGVAGFIAESIQSSHYELDELAGKCDKYSVIYHIYQHDKAISGFQNSGIDQIFEPNTYWFVYSLQRDHNQIVQKNSYSKYDLSDLLEITTVNVIIRTNADKSGKCDKLLNIYIEEFGYCSGQFQIFSYSLHDGKCDKTNDCGVGGAVQYPKGYLKRVYQMIRENGGLCIADEVQTGFGRTGSHFWGFQNHDVIPDIVTMAKGIGNGFPLGAVVTTPEIAKCLTKAHHFNTFGGNPLACAVGSEVLKVIQEEKLQANSRNVGTYLLEKLRKLRDDHEVVGDVRGKGLMIGIEFVADKVSKKPLESAIFGRIWESCKDMGVLIGAGGISGNVMRIKPPMCITKEDADFTVHVLESALKTVDYSPGGA